MSVETYTSETNMHNEKVKSLFDLFDTSDEYVTSEPFGGGHINDTYKVTGARGKYTLQRINTDVFTDPDSVMRNISAVTAHISRKLMSEGMDPLRRTLHVIESHTGEPTVKTEDGVYRMFTFVDNVKTYKKCESADTFYRAASAFGSFGRRLLDFSAETLAVTIPDFHNTPKRYRDLCEAAEADVCGRACEVADDLAYFRLYADFYSVVTSKLDSGEIPLRVTHNDTKLDNVLFDLETDEGICVIDLDTVMPGSVLYDYGDALRVGTNPSAEDADDTSRVECRLDMFTAFTEGYLSELAGVLTECELALMPVAGRLLTLECAMRFLTDYLRGDVYFKTSRPRQNLDRARVGIALARDMVKKEPEMTRIVYEILSKNKK